MNARQPAVALLLLLTLAGSLAFGPLAFAQCAAEAGAGDESCTEQQDAAETDSPGGVIADAGSPAESQPKSYTWDDLLRLVPEMREYQLGFRPNDLDENDQPRYMVCRKFKVTGTHIPQRKCMPLQNFLVYVASQRQRAEQTRIGILLMPGPTPAVYQN